MEENQKSKKENLRKKLSVLEEKIRIQDQKEIQELLKRIDADVIDFDSYLQAINKQLSFKVSFDDVIDEQE